MKPVEGNDMASKQLRELEEQINDRDKEYCRQLVITKGNAKKAAINAGYAPSTAKARAAEWIRKTREDSLKPLLFDYYQLLLQDATTAIGISIESCLRELKSIAMSDITKVVKLNGGLKMTIKSTSEIPEDIKPAIASISKTSYGVVVKFHDKLGALRMLMDYLALTQDQGKGSITIDKVEFNVKGSNSNLLNQTGLTSQKN